MHCMTRKDKSTKAKGQSLCRAQSQKGCISDRQQETCHTCKSYKCSYYQIGHCYDQPECDTCDLASNSSMYFIAS